MRHLLMVIAAAVPALAMVFANTLASAQPAPAPTQAQDITAALAKLKSWKRKVEADRVVYTAPAKAGQPGMTLTLPLMDKPGGTALEDWLKSRVANWVKGRADIYKQQGVSTRGKSVIDGVSFKNAKGKGGDLILFEGWKTRNGAQLAVQFLPEQVSQDDPRVKEAGDFVSILTALQFQLTPDLLAAQKN